LLFDLAADIAHLLPGKEFLDIEAAHPAKQGEHAGAPGLAVGDEGAQGFAEEGDVAGRLLRRARAGHGEVVEADDSLIVEVDVFQAEWGSGLAEGFVLEVGFGDPTEQVGEAGGFEGFSGESPVIEGGAG
jgi:hypothetical protein